MGDLNLKNMKKIIILFALILSMSIIQSCHDELSQVSNINQPRVDALNGELGLAAFAKGGVYLNGVGGYYPTVDDGLLSGNSLGGLVLIVAGLHDSMGDLIYVPWGNNSFKFADNPTDFTLDDNSVVTMPIGVSQPYELKLRNSRAYGPSNAMLLEWTYMYFMNNACNIVLANVDNTVFAAGAAAKKATMKAWAYFWKGYAYSRLGSMYIAGLINDAPNVTSGNYVTNTALIAESQKNFDAALAALNSPDISGDVASYSTVMSLLIPGQCQAGKGGVPNPSAFIRNINTMKARTMLVNTRVKDMKPGDWDNILTLASAGIKASDPVFVMKTTQDPNKSYIDPQFGWSASYTSGSGGTYFVSERLIQDFDQTNDTRFLNNFDLLGSPVVNKRGRGLGFGTRWNLIDGGAGMPNAITYVNVSNYGKDDIYLAGSYEENELMKAEATVRKGNIPAGAAIIDGVRTYQMAGLSPINPGSTLPQALEELRKERRIALLFRALAFYDARRNGITDDKSLGGGRANAVVLSANPTTGATIVNTKAFINYNYLPYFDVPGNELDFNAVLPGSAPVSTTILH
jgi:hypothetical protein